MRIIADTSVFLAVAMDEPERAAVINMTIGAELISPSVLPFEIGNALTALLKKGRLRNDEVQSVWRSTQKVPVELREVDIPHALDIATRERIYSYDAYFLDCALALQCPLMTLDRPLKIVARRLGIQIMEVSQS